MLTKIALATALAFMTGTCAFQTFVLKAESDANKARHAVEQDQFVCVQGGKIITTPSNSFDECMHVTWRYADEKGVS